MINNFCKYSICGALWIINPIYLGGCQDKTTEFSFGQAEMLDLLETVNTQQWSSTVGEETYTLTFSLEQKTSEQASLNILNALASAYACEERSFVAEAGACIDNTSLGVTGTVTIVNQQTEEQVVAEMPISGSMMVMGLDLDNADLQLRQDDGGSFTFYSSDGQSFTSLEASW